MKGIFLTPQSAVFLLLMLVVVLYFQTVNSYYALWLKSGNPAYSHGALAFLIALYMFFKYWLYKDPLPPLKLDYVGFAFLLLSSLVWFIADLGGIQVLQQLALWGLVGSLFWCLFGFGVFNALLIPLAVVLTAVPVWDFLNIHLQHITAVGVSFLLSFTGIPFVKEGVHILLQSGTFEIADRCSGLRMVVASVAISLLYIYQSRLRFSVGVLYVLAAVLLAIFVNVIRILIVVMAGHMTNMQHYFVTTDHVMLGWVLFGIAIFVFIYLSNRVLLSERWYPHVVRRPTVDSAQSSSRQQQLNPMASITLTAAVVGVAIGPVMASVYQSSTDNPRNISLNLSGEYNGWIKQASVGKEWQPVYHGADFKASAQYVHLDRGLSAKSRQKNSGEEPEKVTLHIYYYFSQSQGKEAIHFQNKLFDENNWKIVARKKINESIEDVGHIQADEVIIRSSMGRNKMLWRWYYVGGSRITSALKAKLLGIKGVLTGHPEMTVFVVSTDVKHSQQEAVTILSDFVSSAVVDIESSVNNAVRKNTESNIHLSEYAGNFEQ